MKISPKALAMAFALIWGGAIACTSIVHLVAPSYATSFLELVSSIYPGFHGGRSLSDALVGTLYALLDGGFAGLIVAWLYNLFLPRSGPVSSQD
jgi:hypothetical protein